jgi:hypothetical protein
MDPLQETYVHGVSATADFLACWNMHLAGTLTSSDFVAQVESGAGTSVREVPIDELRSGWPSVGMPLQPRLLGVLTARQVGSPELVTWANRELDLEATRRRYARDAASRLACIWLADDSVEGRNNVSSLKGHQAFIVPVRIVACTRFTRVDARWLEGDLDESVRQGYWSGAARDGANPLWEYLVEGSIACADEADLERLRDWVRANSPPEFGSILKALWGDS